MRTSVILAAYATLVLLAGGYAFVSAPPEANKTTAIAIPGMIAAVSLGLAALWRSAPRNAGRRWLTVGACLLFAGLVAFPAVMRTGKMRNWPEASTQWTAATAADASLAEKAKADRAVRKAFFSERNSPDHDQTYLVITLWTITGLSAAAAALCAISRR
jgi:heme/copper-type cytochrome/quinol oxidase subunit 3